LSEPDTAAPRPAARFGWLHDRLAPVTVVATVVPIAVATTRAVLSGWMPIGDNALFSARSRDVFTTFHPLVGTWTSASLTAGKNLNNPGPLFFDWLAVPAKLSADAGVAVGVALLNIAAVVGIAVIAHRQGGPRTTIVAMAASAGLIWSMGSELLFDPWQPHALLLPFLLLLFCLWAVSCGDTVALPWAAGVASLVVQTHLSYVVLTAATVAVALILLGLALNRHRRENPNDWPRHRRRVRKALGVTALVLVACWAQPVWQQVTARDEGNLHALATSGPATGPTVGIAMATRLTASVVATYPFWARPSFDRRFVLSGLAHLPSTRQSSIALAAVLTLVGVAAALRHRHHDEIATRALGLGAVCLGAGVVTAAILPLNTFGIGIAPHQLRWLWPLGVFLTFCLGLTFTRSLPRLVGQGALLAVATAAVLLSIASIPTYRVAAGPAADAAAIPSARVLVDHLDSLRGGGPYLFDTADLRFAEPYSTTIMAALDQRGIDFRLSDGGWIHQFGPKRRATGREVARLYLRESDAAFESQPGGRLIARADGLTAHEHAEMLRLRDEVRGYIGARGLRLNSRGRDAVAVRALLATPALGPVAHDGDAVIYSGELTLIVRQRLAPIDGRWRARFERYVDLQERWNKHTVALFVAST